FCLLHGRGATFRQPLYPAPIAADKRFLLGSTPTFELSLDSDRVGDAIKIFRPHELNGSAGESVSTGGGGFVLRHPLPEIVAGSTPDVIRVVCAAQHVHVRAHGVSSPGGIHEIARNKLQRHPEEVARPCARPSRRMEAGTALVSILRDDRS